MGKAGTTRAGLRRSGFLVAATVLAVAAGAPANAAPAEGTILNTGGPTAVADSYIVVLNDLSVSSAGVEARARTLAAAHGASVARTYQHALRGFEAHMSAADARKLAADPSVRYVTQNHTVQISGTQAPTPSWGLDRVDQRALPLNSSYTYPTTASNVRAYIIDTGINLTHSDFSPGRAISGRDTVDNDNNATDCQGHGTHVSGTVGGNSYGIAKGVTLVGVRVLNCSGSGTYAGVIAGIDWVTGDHAAGQPAVANMSLGGPADASVNQAVSNSIADGVTYAVAAGNDTGANACNVSPAGTPNAITVGATTSTDARASYSNIGSCLDIFAPGSSITSAWIGGNSATNTISGTSMASPHVAGAAALVASQNPTWTPAQVAAKLVADATPNVVTNPGSGSPNRLLYVDNAGTPANDFSLSVSPAAGSTDPGGSVSATVSTATTSGSAQSVALSATGLPSGATATFSPASVTSGGTSALTITTSASTPAGTYTVTVTGTGASAAHSATFTLTVNGAPGCVGTNPTDVSIPDNTTVTSTITISGCARNASATSSVEVHIVHTYRGDLVISLIAPDGSAYTLLNRSGGSTDNVDQTFTVNLSGEAANGTWTLQVRDAASLDTGYLNSWTLTL